ncbi:hypothetical protein DFJ73DRAFT_593000 [Zopfochytrium polystomum]|nr:hypothetical protein DFJ73DRAFT_593000 [Zopfochytrium polystomum]
MKLAGRSSVARSPAFLFFRLTRSITAGLCILACMPSTCKGLFLGIPRCKRTFGRPPRQPRRLGDVPVSPGKGALPAVADTVCELSANDSVPHPPWPFKTYFANRQQRLAQFGFSARAA